MERDSSRVKGIWIVKFLPSAGVKIGRGPFLAADIEDAGLAFQMPILVDGRSRNNRGLNCEVVLEREKALPKIVGQIALRRADDLCGQWEKLTVIRSPAICVPQGLEQLLWPVCLGHERDLVDRRFWLARRRGRAKR